MSFVSYAQNFEDVLLHRVFGGQETGFYVDVGAYHPVIGSTTKAFYDRGWSGINIEPGSVFVELAAARPRDVNLQMAVLDRAGDVNFVEDESDRGMSHVTMDETSGNPRIVPCDTLEAIVQAHSRGRPVDFVKIDAEGAEAAIVLSTDWCRLRPRVPLLEATSPWSSRLVNHDWEPRLLQQGYVRAYFDGINCFYVPEEESPALLRHFQVPVNVLDRVVQNDYEVLRQMLGSQQTEAGRLASVIDERQKEVSRLAQEQDAIRARFDAQQAEMARLTAEHDAQQAEMARLTAEHDAQQAELVRLTAERDAVRAAFDAQQAEGGCLTAERDAIRAAFAAQQAEVARLTAERDSIHQQVVQMTATPPPSLRSEHRRGARRLALSVYKIVRPVIRPLAWRLRSFMINGLAEQVQRISERIASMPATVASMPSTVIEPPGEMRRLAAEMERALLTLALERGPDSWHVGDPVQPELSAPTPRIALRLPRGRTVKIEYAPNDLSIPAQLKGEWRPDVWRYLETVVQPDWVCLDIGARMGIHTLSLAVLAEQGQVIAFEADAADFELLTRNVHSLPLPRATITPVSLALWNRKDSMVCDCADDLPGCYFVSGTDPGLGLVERRLHTPVHDDAIDSPESHLQVSTLDAWIEENPLTRLDLLMLDVKGSAAEALRGADATLRKYRPVLIVPCSPTPPAPGQTADDLFRDLAIRFDVISALEADGTLTPLPDQAALQTRLGASRCTQYLVCQSDQVTRSQGGSGHN